MNQHYTEEEIAAYKIWGILATTEFRMLVEGHVRRMSGSKGEVAGCQREKLNTSGGFIIYTLTKQYQVDYSKVDELGAARSTCNS